MDFENIPFAEFFEEVIPWLLGFNATRIGIIAMNADDTTGSAYYQCDALDKDIMADAMHWEAVTERLANNKEWLKELLKEEED